MWIMGYNEKGIPLADDEMKEDIMSEYRNKTYTIKPQTFKGIRNISVHPYNKKIFNFFLSFIIKNKFIYNIYNIYYLIYLIDIFETIIYFLSLDK